MEIYNVFTHLSFLIFASWKITLNFPKNMGNTRSAIKKVPFSRKIVYRINLRNNQTGLVVLQSAFYVPLNKMLYYTGRKKSSKSIKHFHGWIHLVFWPWRFFAKIWLINCGIVWQLCHACTPFWHCTFWRYFLQCYFCQ